MASKSWLAVSLDIDCGFAAKNSDWLTEPSPSVSRSEKIDERSLLLDDVEDAFGGGGGMWPAPCAPPFCSDAASCSSVMEPVPSVSIELYKACACWSETSSGFAARNSDSVTEPSPSVSMAENMSDALGALPSVEPAASDGGGGGGICWSISIDVRLESACVLVLLAELLVEDDAEVPLDCPVWALIRLAISDAVSWLDWSF